MINTIDVVTVKYSGSDKALEGKAQYHGTFDRPYFSYGPGDELVTEEKVVDSTDGKVTYKVTSPNGKPTKSDPADLLLAAIDWCSAKQASDIAATKDDAKRVEKEKNKVDPTIILLRYFENAVANEARMAKYQELKPAVIDIDSANKKFALGLVQQGKAKDLDAAYDLMRKLGVM